MVLRGEGTVFSAGIDLRTFTPEGVDGERIVQRIAAADDAEVADMIAGFQRAFTWWHERDDVITVAAVQGAAVGAGFQLALACDLRVAASDARFAMRETSLGLVPDLAGTHPLVRAVGYSRALELCATGRWLEAQEALAWGVVSAVGDDLDALVASTVSGLLAAPDASLRSTKRVLRAALDQDAVAQRRTERENQIGLLRGMLGS